MTESASGRGGGALTNGRERGGGRGVDGKVITATSNGIQTAEYQEHLAHTDAKAPDDSETEKPASDDSSGEMVPTNQGHDTSDSKKDGPPMPSDIPLKDYVDARVEASNADWGAETAKTNSKIDSMVSELRASHAEARAESKIARAEHAEQIAALKEGLLREISGLRGEIGSEIGAIAAQIAEVRVDNAALRSEMSNKASTGTVIATSVGVVFSIGALVVAGYQLGWAAFGEGLTLGPRIDERLIPFNSNIEQLRQDNQNTRELLEALIAMPVETERRD